MKNLNPKVDAFITKARQWQREFTALREIILDCGLEEDLKWGVPCYTLGGKNVVLVHGFKEYCAILFVKGSLLNDEKGILYTQTENTQASRQVRFGELQEIVKMKSILNDYISQAIQVEKAGLKVNFKPTSEFKMPDEFQHKLNEMPTLKTAFDALTPGRQRAYLLFFGAPKQSKTREARIEKSIPQILKGKGLND